MYVCLRSQQIKSKNFHVQSLKNAMYFLHTTKEWLIFFQSHEKSRKQDAAVQPLATTATPFS